MEWCEAISHLYLPRFSSSYKRRHLPPAIYGSGARPERPQQLRHSNGSTSPREYRNQQRHQLLATMNVNTIILPGIGGSGESHWQTVWRRHDPCATVFQPSSWDQPELDDWIAALDRAVASAAQPPLLVAHSLACLLVAHWAARGAAHVAGAFLVAVPDPDGPVFPAEQAATFRAVPSQALPFPTLVVASSDDPYGSLGYVQRCAADWEAGLVVAGALGHINDASGLGEWPFGAALLTSFRAGLAGKGMFPVGRPASGCS
jgi:uncharacterized protein